MFKDLRIRVLITAIIVGTCLVFLLPTLVPEIPSAIKPYLPKDKIRLGLDLQGGMNLVLEVETEKALESTAERLANDLKDTLIEKKVRFRDLEKGKGYTISLELTNRESRDVFSKTIQDGYPDLEEKSTEIADGNEKVVLKIKDKEQTRSENRPLNKAWRPFATGLISSACPNRRSFLREKIAS